MNLIKDHLPFCLIIIFAFIIRISGLNFESLWLDESYQSLVGAYGNGIPDFIHYKPEKFIFKFEHPSTLSDLLTKFRSVDPLCPPLYAVLLNIWLKCLGSDDFTIRFLSLIFSILSIAFTMFFAHKWLGKKAAILAGLMQAISPFDVHYAQEARMYSLTVLCSLISCASLITIIGQNYLIDPSSSSNSPNSTNNLANNPVKSPVKNKIQLVLFSTLYIFSSWAMINSHYTSLFLLASQGILACIYLFFTKRFKLLALLMLLWSLIICLWLPWLNLFLQAASSRKESFYVSKQANILWAIYALFIRTPVNWLIFLSGQRVVAFAFPLYVSSALCLASAVKYLFSKESQNKLTSYTHSIFFIACLVLWAISPAFLLWIMDILENHRVVEIPRYTIFCLPAICTLAGFGLSNLSKKKKIFALLLSTHLLFACINLFYCHTVFQKEPWKEMAKIIEKTVPCDEPLVISQHYNLVCIDRYLSKPRLQLGLSPAMGKDIIERNLLQFTNFALLTAQDGETIKNLIPDKFKLTKQVDMPHGLHLRLYKTDPK